MKQYYIFSEMFGSYSYQIHITEAKSLQEAIAKAGLEDSNVRDFNYFPKLDPTYAISIEPSKKSLFSKEELAIFNTLQEREKKIKFIKDNYERVLLNLSEWGCTKSISGEMFIETETQGWYDYIILKGNLPANYCFSDGHDG